jgi:HrpA-like RNA helicase
MVTIVKKHVFNSISLCFAFDRCCVSFRLERILVRRNLARLVLWVLQMGVVPRALLCKLLDPPSDKQLRAADVELREIGATGADNKITGLGRLLETLPLEPRLGVSLALGLLADVHMSMAPVIAVLSVQAFHNATATDDLCRSDVLVAADALTRYEQACSCEKKKQVCEVAGIAPHVMQQLQTALTQLLLCLARLTRKSLLSNPSPTEALKRDWPTISFLLAAGLSHNIALHTESSRIRLQTGLARISSESIWNPRNNFASGPPEVLLVGGLVPVKLGCRALQFCRGVTPSSLLALLVLCPQFEWTDRTWKGLCTTLGHILFMYNLQYAT